MKQAVRIARLPSAGLGRTRSIINPATDRVALCHERYLFVQVHLDPSRTDFPLAFWCVVAEEKRLGIDCFHASSHRGAVSAAPASPRGNVKATVRSRSPSPSAPTRRLYSVTPRARTQLNNLPTGLESARPAQAQQHPGTPRRSRLASAPQWRCFLAERKPVSAASGSPVRARTMLLATLWGTNSPERRAAL